MESASTSRLTIGTLLSSALFRTRRITFAALLAALSTAPAFAHEGETHSGDQPSSPISPSMPESKSQIMKLTDDGIVPDTLVLRPEDSVVFFLNDSSDSLVGIEIEFKDHVTHCGGGNLQQREKGIVATKQPIEPRAFNTSCFHEKGTYPIRVLGLKKNPAGVSAKVVVE